MILKTKVKVTEYNIRHDAIRWQMTKSFKVFLRIFALSPTIFDILTFRKHNRKFRSRSQRTTCAMLSFDGGYQRVLKVTECIFVIALIISEMLTFQNVDLDNIGQDYRVQDSQ